MITLIMTIVGYTVFPIALGLVSLKLYIKLTTGICHSQVCLKGKTAIVLGANTGIGYETAIDFAKRGARVILACRNEDRAKDAMKRIREETHNENVTYKLIDLASFTSVRKFAEDVKDTESRLDILVNNAGVLALDNKITEDGLPVVIQIDYFSHFLLISLLLDLLNMNPSRVVNVSSLAAKSGKIKFNKLTTYQGKFNQYSTSKLCQILFTTEFARRYPNTNVKIYSLHPGVIKSDLYRNMQSWLRTIILYIIDWFLKTSTEGAQTQIHCSIANGLEKFNGEHFHDCHPVRRYKSAKDSELARKVWEESEKIVKLKMDQNYKITEIS